MRLPVDAALRVLALGLTVVPLAGCGALGGNDAPRSAGLAADATGPSADYPMVLGDPFTIDGELYTPADVMNYDVVGYAALDEGQGITVAHRTLPLPSYAEVTSLTTGKTILVRVERRGPMAGRDLIALSPATAELLGEASGAPVRLRRVNPPEAERAELRAGRAAPDRIETPKSLVEVLRRKLPATGAASLRAPDVSRVAITEVRPEPATSAPPPPQPVSMPAAAPEPASVPTPSTTTAHDATGLVVQAGAFANRGNADRAAKALGGFVSPDGKWFRVRTGPFASRGQADAALAKVRAAGYSDARVYTAK